MFLQGLPEGIQEKIMKKSGVNPKRPTTMKFDKVKRAMEEYIEDKAGLKLIQQSAQPSSKGKELQPGMTQSLVVIQPDGRIPNPPESQKTEVP